MRKDDNGNWVSKGLNLAASAEYGDLIIVWPPDASVLSGDFIEREALNAAARYNDEVDWVLALGSPSLIAVLAWAIGFHGKTLRMLEWDRAAQRYVRTLNPTTNDPERNRYGNGYKAESKTGD
jgi:hypothetical protein